jgi:HEPN domain-containing protein
MWRFYGDNAHGACMVFESKENSETGIKEVLYINKETNDSVKRMNEILSKLKDDKINFRFPYLISISLSINQRILRMRQNIVC